MNKVEANKELWPDDLKSSRDYYASEPIYYYDHKYKCHKCSVSAVYTAQEQKHDIEVCKKSGVCKVLCEPCFHKYNDLKSELRKYKSLWLQETENSKNNASYLNDWLNCLREYKKYTKKYDQGMERKLEKLLGHE